MLGKTLDDLERSMIQVQVNNLYYPFVGCLSSEWSLGDRACNSFLAFSSDRMVLLYASMLQAGTRMKVDKIFNAKERIREHLITHVRSYFPDASSRLWSEVGVQRLLGNKQEPSDSGGELPRQLPHTAEVAEL